MPLYIGVQNDRGVNKLYLSEAPWMSEEFDLTQIANVECSDQGQYSVGVAKGDLRRLYNILRGSGLKASDVIME